MINMFNMYALHIFQAITFFLLAPTATKFGCKVVCLISHAATEDFNVLHNLDPGHVNCQNLKNPCLQLG
jgi:hypothetical protein